MPTKGKDQEAGGNILYGQNIKDLLGCI